MYTLVMHHSHSRGKRTFGEALITFGALVGFFTAYILGKITTWHEVWLIVGMLGLLVVFYWLLLLARFIFIAMVSGTEHGFDWEKFIHHQGTDAACSGEGCCGGKCCEKK